MARRRRARFTPRPPDDDPQLRRLGSHWRADGAPKATYVTQGEALSVAEERRHENGVELSVYQCDVCAGWHLANKEGARR